MFIWVQALNVFITNSRDKTASCKSLQPVSVPHNRGGYYGVQKREESSGGTRGAYCPIGVGTVRHIGGVGELTPKRRGGPTRARGWARFASLCDQETISIIQSPARTKKRELIIGSSAKN